MHNPPGISPLAFTSCFWLGRYVGVYAKNVILCTILVQLNREPGRPGDHDDIMTDYASGPLMANDTLYPIREVSRLSGVNAVTLRAWERRYGLLVPQRTESGHRLYSMRDVERVKAIVSWIGRGVPVSKVASIIDRQSQPEPSSANAAHIDEQADHDMLVARTQLMDAVASGELRELELAYSLLFSRWPLAQVCNDVLLPVWRQYSARARQTGFTAQWALLDGFLRGRLLQRIASVRPDRPSVLLASLQPLESEVEVLLASLFLAEADVNIAYLPSLPASEDLLVMTQNASYQALLLFSDLALDSSLVTRQLPRLNQQLDCPVAVLGACCELQASSLSLAHIGRLGLVQATLTERLRQLLSGHLDS